MKTINRYLGIRMIPLFLVLCNTCSNEQTPSTLTAVIDKDQRQQLGNRALSPLFGKLSIGNQTLCTGFMSNFTEVSTANHCLWPFLKDKTNIKKLRFESSWGVTHSVKDIVFRNESADVIILSIGGGFHLSFPSGPADPDQPVKIVSYQASTQKYVTVDDCKIVRQNKMQGYFFHDCDTEPSASGSPLIQGGKVVGMHIGYSKENGANVAVEYDQLFSANLDSANIDEFEKSQSWERCMLTCATATVLCGTICTVAPFDPSLSTTAACITCGITLCSVPCMWN